MKLDLFSTIEKEEEENRKKKIGQTDKETERKFGIFCEAYKPIIVEDED